MISVADWQWPTILHQRMHGPRKLFGLMPCIARSRAAMRNGRHRTWKRGRPSWSALAAKPSRGGPDPRSLQFSFATYRHAWPKRLAQGRICLVGDAAHAMSPQLGLGSTLAMGDALVLAR